MSKFQEYLEQNKASILKERFSKIQKQTNYEDKLKLVWTWIKQGTLSFREFQYLISNINL